MLHLRSGRRRRRVVGASLPHRTGRYHPHGLQMHKVVEARLSCWGLCEQGDWWGLVTYEIAYGAKQKTVTHWVPAWTLRRMRHGRA